MRSLGLIMIAAVIALSHVSPAFAASVPDTESNAYYTRNNIIFYSANDGATVCVSDASSTVALRGESNREKGYNFLTDKGLTDEQAAGVIGNLMVESGMVPDNQEDSQSWENGGWGLAQWTGPRRTDLKAAVQAADLPYTNEQTPADQMEKLLAFELNYLWTDATRRGDIESLKAEAPNGGGKTSEQVIEAAVISWEKHYERAGVPALGARYDRAIDAFNDFGGASSGFSNVSNSSSGCNTNGNGDFVYYSQYDPAWADVPYGTSGKTVQSSGCGPSSMAMIVATMTGDRSVTPETIASKYGRFYIQNEGSSHELFGTVASDYGLKSKLVATSQAALDEALGSGGLVVAGGSGSYPFTDDGHILVIRQVTSSGKYLIGNPLPTANNQSKSSDAAMQDTTWFNKEYSWSELTGSIKTIYVINQGDIST